MSWLQPDVSRSIVNNTLRRLLYSESPALGNNRDNIRRVCSTETYSVMSRAEIHHVSTVCVPGVFTSFTAFPALTNTASDPPPGISDSVPTFTYPVPSANRLSNGQSRRIFDSKPYFQLPALFRSYIRLTDANKVMSQPKPVV